MGKLTAFYITLAEQHNFVFHAGEVISGSVTVDLLEPMEMKGRLIYFDSSNF